MFNAESPSARISSAATFTIRSRVARPLGVSRCTSGGSAIAIAPGYRPRPPDYGICGPLCRRGCQAAASCLARKARISPVTSSRADSSKKCPPSIRWISASGRSSANASAPAGPNISSPRPHTASSGTPLARKYSCKRGYSGEFVIPRFRIDQRLVSDTRDVLPAGGLQGEELPYRGLGPGGRPGLVVPHGLPEALNEASVVAVAVLADDRRDGGRVGKREPPPDGGTVVLHVHRIRVDSLVTQQASRQRGERVEGVVELFDGGRVRKPETQMIRRYHVVAVRQRRNQLPEHV